MSRIVRRSAIVAAGLAGLLLAFGPAQASTLRVYGPACAGPASAARLTCRSARIARRPVRTYRPLIVEARLSAVDPALYGASRYVSLLILGVGF